MSAYSGAGQFLPPLPLCHPVLSVVGRDFFCPVGGRRQPNYIEAFSSWKGNKDLDEGNQMPLIKHSSVGRETRDSR